MSYQRALADRLRTVAAVGFRPDHNLQLPLASIYVDRALTSIALEQSAPRAAPPQPVAALAERPGARVWVSGQPGAGTTTLLRRLALACASRSAGEVDRAPLLDAWHDPVPTPVLLDLRAAPDAADLAAWLDADGLAQFAAELEPQLAAGQGLVLVDGAGDPAELAALAALVTRFPANRFVVAGRPGVPPPPGFAPYELPPLSREQIDAFVERWLRALGPVQGALEDRIASLQGRLLPNADLLALVAWPPALALAVAADVRGLPLPEGRADLYRRLVEVRLGQDAPRALPALIRIAQALQERAAYAEPALGSDEAVAVAGTPDAAEAIRLLARSGLVFHSADRLTMPPALRQFLAAEALAAEPDFEARALASAADPAWEETLLLAARERQRVAPVDELVGRLARGAMQRGYASGGWRGVALAAEMLRDIGDAEGIELVRREVADALVELVGATAVPLAERVRAGRILGDIGDPRFTDLLPETVLVEGGSFLLGADVAGFDDEGPPQRIDVPTFRIGAYPVTNSEYARFLDAVPSHPRPHYWHDPRFNNPSLPVVGVTWNDAVAFCAWLTRAALLDRLIPPGVVVRLPLEAEWEKAATWGPNARTKTVFPWGDRWDEGRANTAEGRQAWLTTPVGCYPQGISRYGAHDMTGNVWEWTASEYASYPGTRRPQHQPGHYVLRGSSCVSVRANVRATYRGSHLPPHYWRYHLGFRIVIGKPLPPRPQDGDG